MDDPASSVSTPSAPLGGAAAFSLRRYLKVVLALDGPLLVLSCAVGGLAGLLATVYFFALDWMLKLSGWLDGKLPVVAVMGGMGVLVGLSYLLGHPGETDAVVDNIHLNNGRMDTKANLPLVPCSLLSISAGGSAGPEAPMVYLTGSVGTWLHKWLKLPESYVRTLTLTGMGVGFATLFGAPVGSAIFALEIPHKRGMEYFEATVPAIMGTLVGYGVFSALTHHGLASTWQFPAYHLQTWHDLPLALMVGIACGLASMPFVTGIHAVKKLFDWPKRLPWFVRTAIAGLVLGLVAWKLPATRFWGEEQLQHFLLDASPLWWMLLLFAVAKMFTVAVTLAGGWKGGIIIPCFFIGACLGKALALIAAIWFPGVLDPTLAMLCGMAAVNVSVMKVPLATVLVVSAMSGVAAIAPIATAAFAAFAVTGGVNFLHTKRDRFTAPVPAPAESAAA